MTWSLAEHVRKSWSSLPMLALVLAGCSAKDPETSTTTLPDSSDAMAQDEGRGGDARDGGSSSLEDAMPPVTSYEAGPRAQGDGGACVNLQCRQRACAGGASTTISGKVYDPAGRNPLYNVVVYVPNAPVQALSKGASCDSCSSLFTGSPIAVAQTNARGEFTLKNAPDGSDIPLVVQVGKWRKQYKLPNVSACQDNPQPDKQLRLPKNRAEGDIPNIAISTGEADTLECLLRRIGVDASEYVPGPNAQGSIHVYRGSDGSDGDAHDTDPSAPSSSETLWNSKDSLMKYDILLLSCEGQETEDMNQNALHDYANAGGRVFASHYHYAWFNSGPFASENLAAWDPGSNHIGDIDADVVTKLADGRTFPKGQALSDWLANVGALRNGKLPISEARNNAVVNASHTPSQSWLVADDKSEAPGATQYFSFNTPTTLMTGPDITPAYCGRVVFSDLHVGAASGDDEDEPVPTGCADRPLSPQEAALEFMLFDLSSCVMEDDRPPEPPPVVILE
jgi:hypothetical protein